MLATGGDGPARLWDADSGTSIATLTGAAGPVWSVAFSPDGTMLATGSDDGTAGLWDVATRRQIGGPLTADPVNSVAFSPDGTMLATGGDGTVRLWDVAYLVDIVPHLCASARRSPTRTEWTRYAPGTAYRDICP